MSRVTAKTAKKTAQSAADGKISRENATLARCYHEIGISAVAAAVRYQGVAKNPAYAPVPTKWHEHEEAA
jgi:hypothetical protein